MTTKKPWLTPADLASETGLSLATIGRRFRSGDAPPSVYIGRCRLIPAGAEAADWIERHRTAA
jgi:predicted DNA-binding transcriptional regulator AlpA